MELSHERFGRRRAAGRQHHHLGARPAQGADVGPVEGVAEDTPLPHDGAHCDSDQRALQRCQEASMLTPTLPGATVQLVGFAA